MVAVRSSGARWQERDGRDSARVGGADGVVHGDLAATQVGGSLRGEGRIGDEVSKADSRERGGIRRRSDGSGGGDVEVDAPHATAGGVGMSDGAVRASGESVFDGELDGGRAGELVPKEGEENGRERWGVA